MKNKDKILMGAMAGLLVLNVSSPQTLAEAKHNIDMFSQKESKGFFSKLFRKGTDKSNEAKKSVGKTCSGKDCKDKDHAKDACSGKDGCKSTEKDACSGKDGCKSTEKDACSGKDGCKSTEKDACSGEDGCNAAK
jgi:hypothetical protein